MRARNLFAALLFAALPATATVPAAQQVDVVEFYNATLDHYFVTTDAKEAADLDSGVHVGWARTGLTFKAIRPGAAVPGSVSICRFYGKPEAKLDSHFYSASATECASVQEKFADAWLLESTEVFRSFPVDPTTGKCATDSEPVFRLWNNRADVNHRYTTQMSVYTAMVAKGYVAEGNGNPAQPVIFCMPVKDSSVAAPGTPACSLASSISNPLLGASITLTATCTNTPTSFTWTGCTSAGNSCIATASAAGLVTYSVVGTNATGAGNTAKVDVSWQSSGGAQPICTISATNLAPAAGAGVILTASCSQSPASYDWLTCNYLIQSACNFITTCSVTSPTCTTNQATAGKAHYAVAGTNSAGQGPRAGIDIDWSGGTPPPPPPTPTVPACSVTASNATPTTGTSITLVASCSGSPTSYAWTNCASTGPTCSATSATAGSATYSVVATNAVGPSPSTSVSVTWQPPAPPSCTLKSNATAPIVNSMITLTATCSGAPTKYIWTGCPAASPTASTCNPLQFSPGSVTYYVAAQNANGTGPTASVTVDWKPLPSAAPVCSVTSSDSAPFTGTPITLTATCSNSPETYSWTNCASTTSTCVATGSAAGVQTYSVTADNAIGKGAAASVAVAWQASTAAGDFCGAYPNVVRTTVPWGSSPTIYTKDFGPLMANGVAVVAIVVPSAISPTARGRLQWAEYVDPRGSRTVTLSRSPCDFRSTDASGNNGPMVSTGGVSGDVYYTLSTPVFGYPEGKVMPGQTVYVNLRQPGGCGSGSGSCNMVLGLSWF